MLATTIDIISHEAHEAWANRKENDRATYQLTLDDVVEALCNRISVDDKADEDSRVPNLQTSEHRNYGESDHGKKGTMMAKRREPGSSVHEPIWKKPYILPRTSRKKDNFC